MKDLKISVCIPTYNQSVFIEQSIRSASIQTVRPIEIIVSDDCSTDATSEILQRLSLEIPFLKVFRQTKNVGISRNVDYCLRLAKGDYILRLDSDDYLSPVYIEKLIQLLACNPEAGYAHAAVQEVDQDGGFKKKRMLGRSSGFQKGDDALKAAVKGFRVAANIIIFKRIALEQVNYVVSDSNFAEDYYLAASLSAAGYGNFYLNEILSYYRVWDDSDKLRHKRKLAEIIGLRKVFEEVLKPAFIQRGWSIAPLNKQKAKIASIHADCLSWDVYSENEKEAILTELNKLSSSLKIKAIAWIYLNGFGGIIDKYRKTKASLRYLFKTILLRLKS